MNKELDIDHLVEMQSSVDTLSKRIVMKEIGFERNNVNVEGLRLAKKPYILKMVEERKQMVLEHSNVTPEMILGATAVRAFASIDDAFDENGNFDIKKARKTGAIHLIKKLERTKYGFKVEFYSNEQAQDKLGNYLGMEYAPKDNDQSNSLKQGIEEVARAIANGEDPTFEHKQIAWKQVRDWAVAKGAHYNPATILEMNKEFGDH